MQCSRIEKNETPSKEVLTEAVSFSVKLSLPDSFYYDMLWYRVVGPTCHNF